MEKKNILSVVVGALIGAVLTYFVLQNSVFNLGMGGPSSRNSADINISNYSYFMGVSMGRNLLAQEIEVSVYDLYEGLADSYNNEELRMTEEQLENARMVFIEIATAKRLKRMEQDIAANKEAGALFMESNAENPNTITLDSGLQYRVLKEGTGKEVANAKTIKVHYEGRTIEGETFDSSYERGQPIELDARPEGVIEGWKQILKLMREGDEYEVYIPSDLAYGDAGSQPIIQPGATLIFKMELVEAK